jgi:hypothetical protein
VNLRFPALDAIPSVNAAFVGRVGGIDVDCDREEALARLRPAHDVARAALGFPETMATCEQVHGDRVCRVASMGTTPNCDGLVTTTPGLCLGIYVADCAAVFLADRHARAIGLVHSGRKGTEANIVANAVSAICAAGSLDADDLVAVIAPCIRPPHYEVDFAAQIREQLATEGVEQIFDDSVCTASHPEAFYSYRRERGKTGRMLALLALR